MKRDRIDFEMFKANFIVRPDGWFPGGYLPVHSTFGEDCEGDSLRVLNLDMICEWRLADGKIMFVEIPFTTEDEFNQLVEYLRFAADFLHKTILKDIDALDYLATKPEVSD